MTELNEELKTLCAAFDGSLHIDASADRVTFHAIQCRQDMSTEAGIYEQEMRSTAGHTTAADAVTACLAMPWIKVERKEANA